MALLDFKPRFVPFIRDGRKQHTIRDLRKDGRVPKPGEICHCYTGLRRKGARLIGRWPCVKVEQIEILNGAFGDENHALVKIEGVVLDRSERESLARRDGFENFADMMTFWDGRLPFKGHIIYWRFKK